MEHEENTSTRDRLALSRTELANQRTFLAYIRTALAFFSAGIAIIQFIDGNKTLNVIGIVLIGLAPLFIIAGIISYRKYNSNKP